MEIGCCGHIPPLLAPLACICKVRKGEGGATKVDSYSFVHQQQQQLNASSLRSPALVEMEDATEAACCKSVNRDEFNVKCKRLVLRCSGRPYRPQKKMSKTSLKLFRSFVWFWERFCNATYHDPKLSFAGLVLIVHRAVLGEHGQVQVPVASKVEPKSQVYFKPLICISSIGGH